MGDAALEQIPGVSNGYMVAVSDGGGDREWDAFVDRVPGGHHVQSSLWGEVKRTVGWDTARVVVSEDGKIVAGCQVLLRRMGPFVVGYVTRGPLAATQAALDVAFDGLDHLVRRRRLLYVKVQPATGPDRAARALEQRCFVASGLAAGPTATVLVELDRSPGEVLAAMRAGVRSNIRKAERKGVALRLGDATDLPLFFRMVDATSRRQGFPPYPLAYYEAIWRLFSAEGRAALVVAEHVGTPVSALLLVGYCDTVTYKMGGWSGERSGIHPNEAAHWAGMTWAREQGYRFYDLEGIDRRLAESLVQGKDVPRADRPNVDHFKLGFGGRVVLLPTAYDRSDLPVVSAVVRRLAPRLDRWEGIARRLVGRRS